MYRPTLVLTDMQLRRNYLIFPYRVRMRLGLYFIAITCRFIVMISTVLCEYLGGVVMRREKLFKIITLTTCFKLVKVGDLISNNYQLSGLFRYLNNFKYFLKCLLIYLVKKNLIFMTFVRLIKISFHELWALDDLKF